MLKIYGKSLYDLAKEENMSDRIFSELKYIAGLFAENPDYAKLLDSPNFSRNDLNTIIDDDLSDSVSIYMLNFIKLLSENHLVSHIDVCLKEFEQQYNKDNNIKIVRVITAKPLNSVSEDRLKEKLSRKTGSRIILHKTVDEKCIGGIIIEMDGIRIDSSIRSGLLEMKNTLI